MAEKLEFDLLIKNNKLLSGLNDTIKKSDELGGSLQVALGVVGGNLATKGIELLGRALREAIGFAKDSVKAFSEQEDALNKLAQALRASSEFSVYALEDFTAFASAMQKGSRFGDELVLSQLAVAKSFGASNEKAKELVQAAINLTATFGGSLEGNLEKLGKTLSGTTGKLAQFIPELKALSKEQLAAGEAADVINRKFGGAGASELDTYSGSVTALGNAFSDFQEEVGRLLAKNSLTIGAVSLLKSTFEGLGNAIKTATDFLGVGLSPLDAQKAKIAELGDEWVRLNGFVEANKEKVAEMEAANSGNILGELRNKAQITKEIATDEARMNAILQERLNIQKTLAADKATADGSGGKSGVDVDAATLTNRKKLNDEILNLDKQLELERSNFADQASNLAIDSEIVKNEEELQRTREYEAQKIELEFELAVASANRLEDAEAGKLAILKASKDKEIALIKSAGANAKKEDEAAQRNTLESAKATATIEAKKWQTIGEFTAAGVNLASALAKDGSKEAFIIQKAGAIAQAFIATQLGAAQALALGPIVGPPLAAKMELLGAINIAAITATAIKGFAAGGIIGGDSGASMGEDDTMIKARNGEMVLNADQQKKLFSMISYGGGGGDIVVQVDGREIARAVRTAKDQGFRI